MEAVQTPPAWLQRTNGHPYHPQALFDAEGRPMLVCRFGVCRVNAARPGPACKCRLIVDASPVAPCKPCGKSKKAAAGND